VAPARFVGIDPGSVDLWIPFSQDRKLGNDAYRLTNRMAIWLQMVGRLAPGVTREAAAADLNSILLHAAESTPLLDPTPKLTLGPTFAARGPSSSQEARLSLWLALASGLLLAIACANTANLLLARAAARRREIAIRLSIGAGRPRLLQQLLTESMLLALLGAALGIMLALWGSALVPVGGGLPRMDFFAHGRVLGFAVAAAVLCGIIFGLAPALWATRTDLSLAMKDGGREGTDNRSRLRSTLMVLQVALAVVLLTGAGLFVHSLRNVQSIDPGFDADHMLRASIDLERAGYGDTAAAELYGRAERTLRSVPGVRGVALSSSTPLSGGSFLMGFGIPGFADPVPNDHSPYPGKPMAGEAPITTVVGDGYFSAVGTPILLGRDFAASDRSGSEQVAIVNQSFAH
jgi:predicted permease